MNLIGYLLTQSAFDGMLFNIGFYQVLILEELYFPSMISHQYQRIVLNRLSTLPVFVPAPLRGNKLDQVVFILLILWYGDFCYFLCVPLTLRHQQLRCVGVDLPNCLKSDLVYLLCQWILQTKIKNVLVYKMLTMTIMILNTKKMSSIHYYHKLSLSVYYLVGYLNSLY